MCESFGDYMPRNQGNKVAPAAELGDGFDLAAALRVRLVPLVRRLDEFSRFLEGGVVVRGCPPMSAATVASSRIAAWH